MAAVHILLPYLQSKLCHSPTNHDFPFETLVFGPVMKINTWEVNLSLFFSLFFFFFSIMQLFSEQAENHFKLCINVSDTVLSYQHSIHKLKAFSLHLVSNLSFL